MKRCYRDTDSLIKVGDLLREDLERETKRNYVLTVRTMIHAFLATGAFFNVVGDSMGYNNYTVSRLVDQVTGALLTRLRFAV